MSQRWRKTQAALALGANTPQEPTLGPTSLQLTNFAIQLPSAMPSRLFEAPTKAHLATYCLLSLISVVAYQSQPSEGSNFAMQLLWVNIPSIAVMFFHMIDDFIKGHPPTDTEIKPTPYYTIPISLVLTRLGHVALWTKSHLAVAPTVPDHGTDVQACAIHFAMSFFLLSECEFYRLYWIAHRHEQHFNLRTLIDTIDVANHNPNFEGSRDCINYAFKRPHLELPPRHGWISRDTCRRHLVDLFSFYFFHMVAMAFLNYPIKRLANPDPNGDSFPLPLLSLNVFFTPRHSVFGFLDLQLQRPVRLFNRMLFWSMVDCIARVRRWWNSINPPQQSQSKRH